MGKRAYQGETIWIIGASSGIGEALAVELGRRGAILALSARRQAALDDLRASLGEGHGVYPFDVRDADATIRTAQAITAELGSIDRVIFLAAIYTPMRLDGLDGDQSRQIVEINLLGALHTIQAVLPLFMDQERGQIALCGSVAGYIGLPAGQPYSATKAAVASLAESLRSECPPIIDVKLISPGFVKTPLTDQNTFEMPMMITPEQAATQIARGLVGSGFEVHFPKRFTFWMKLLRLLPYGLSLRLLRRLKP